MDFINKLLNLNLFVSKKNLINTRLSDIEINYNIFKEIVLGLEKSDENNNLTIDEEVEKKISQIYKKASISPISKYMPHSINVNLFPIQYQNKGENNEDDDSEETKYSYKDSCDLINQLEKNIKIFRIKNKDVQEKNKKIIIKNDGKNEEDENIGENEEDSEYEEENSNEDNEEFEEEY